MSLRVDSVLAESMNGAKLYRKHGCPRCSNTGYRGRIGVFQYMKMNDELEHLTARKASRDELEAAALATGMRSLWDDGMDKVVAGLTSVDELGRVVV
jgi:type IV pilus assembly protein PilB